MVRDLVGTVEQQKAEMGILLVMSPVTKGMAEVAATAGNYEAPLTRTTYPKVQIITVADLLNHKQPKMPTAIIPYLKARPRGGQQLTLMGHQVVAPESFVPDGAIGEDGEALDVLDDQSAGDDLLPT